MNDRDKKIIKDGEERNIPVIVFIAKDEMSLPMLEYYYQICADSGCNQDFLHLILDKIGQFVSWKDSNLDKIHLPD